ncbi:MAG: CHASE2 domain-containing protein [Desulfobacterales bacterium]|nr:CHASE2 domain-containing protein [Desulfobacterales bacterium]
MTALNTGRKPGKGYYVIMLAGLVVIFFIEYIGLFEGVDNYFYDLSFRLRGSRSPSDRIVIVSIDEETLEKVGRWPLERRHYATLLDRLSEADIVAFDIIMSEPAGDDPVLAEAVREHGRVVLPVYIEGKKKRIVYPAPSLAPFRLGHLHVERDIDWVVRSAFHTIYHNEKSWPSFSSVIYEAAENVSLDRDELSFEEKADLLSGRILQKDPTRINFYGPPTPSKKNTFETHSFSEIIDAARPLPSFKGKIVLTGVTAEGIGDRKLTPFSESRKGSPGVHVHACLLNNLMDKTDITRVPGGARQVLALLLSLPCFLLFLRMGEKKSALLYLFVLLLVTLSILFLHSARNLWINPAVFYFSVTFIYIFTYILRLDVAARELDRECAAIHSSIRRKVKESRKASRDMGLIGFFTTGGVNSRVRLLGRVMDQLLFEKALTDAALDSDIHGVMLYDDGGGLLVANEQARRIFQRAGVAVDALETFSRDITPYIMEDATMDNVIENLKRGERSPLTIALTNREKHYFKMDVSPLDSGGNAHLFFAFTDITKIKELELLKGQIVSMASHELKSPITAIQGFSELLLESLEGEEKDFADIIFKESRRLTRFINTFLDISRIESGGRKIRKRPVQLPEAAGEVLEAITPLADKKEISLSLEAPPGMNVVMIDQDLVKQCILNLIENAVKYSPPGSDVLLKLREEKGRSLIEVIDNGPGVAEEDMDRIFDKFYRGSRNLNGTKGSGLGLAFVKDAVEMQGGAVSVKSAPGKGAAFTISIPREE